VSATDYQELLEGRAIAEEKEPSGAAKQFGDFAPGLVGFTDDVLFGQLWRARSCRRGTAARSPWPR
jgi:hypothetical protein